MQNMGPAVVITGIICFVVLAIAVGMYTSRQRWLAFEELAKSLGFAFTPQPGLQVLNPVPKFQLLHAGRRQQIVNLLTGSTDSTQVMIFDWSYVTGGGKSSHTHSSTLVAIQSADLHVPAFLCRPESLLDWIGLTFDGKDIDFEDQPLFSKKYHLHGNHESRVRQFFDRAVCEFFEQHEGSYAEANGEWMIYCREGKASNPAKIRNLFQDAFQLYLLLKGVPAEAPATSSDATVSNEARDEMPPESERQF